MIKYIRKMKNYLLSFIFEEVQQVKQLYFHPPFHAHFFITGGIYRKKLMTEIISFYKKALQVK